MSTRLTATVADRVAMRKTRETREEYLARVQRERSSLRRAVMPNHNDRPHTPPTVPTPPRPDDTWRFGLARDLDVQLDFYGRRPTRDDLKALRAYLDLAEHALEEGGSKC